MAYWLGYLRLIGQAYYGLFAWFFVAYCRLIAAYWPGLLWLTGLAYCNTLSAYWSSSHPAYPELLRLTKQFFDRLVLCLLEKPRHMITLTNPGLPACFLRKEEALPSTKPLIKHTLTCLDYCCLPAVLASLAYLCDLFSTPKTWISGKHSRSHKKSTVRLSSIPTRPCPWCSIWQWSAVPRSVWKVVFVCCFRRALSIRHNSMWF